MRDLTRVLDRLLRLALSVTLALGGFTVYAEDGPSWGKDGWPSLPGSIKPLQEWTGGEGERRVVGPDGNKVRFTGQRHEGQPIVMSRDKKGNIFESVVPAAPKGDTFKGALEFKVSTAREDVRPIMNIPEAPKPPGPLRKAGETALRVAAKAFPNAPAEDAPPAWGKDGWPAIPTKVVAGAVWSGGEGRKRPRSPDGYSPVRFKGQRDAEGRWLVFALDKRTNVIWEGVIPDAPKAEVFAEAIAFQKMQPHAVVEGKVVPVEVGPPSTWEKAVRLSNRTRATMREQFRRVFSGKGTLLDIQQGKLGGTATEAADVLNRFPSQSLIFGLALGIGAAWRLNMDYPNNPIAWQKYTDEMQDPIFWVSLAGFSIAMAPAIAWMKNTPPTFLRQMPIYAAGSAFATLIQVGIETFARDADFTKCMGFNSQFHSAAPWNNSGELPFKERDLKACDRLYSSAKMKRIAGDIVSNAFPAMASMAISGGVFFYMLTKLQSSVTFQRLMTLGVTAAEASAPVRAIRVAATMGLSIGLTAAFVTAVSAPAAWITRPMTLGAKAQRYGLAETALYDAWERARRTGWTDPNALDTTEDVCQEGEGENARFFNCTRKPAPDLTAVIDAYKDESLEWRTTQMQPVISAYGDWLQKVSSYRQTLETSREFYANALTKILYARQNPGASPNDPQVFNQEAMRIQTVSPTLRAPDRSFIARYGVIDSHDGSWRYVSTPRLEEFLTTSMACGPEAEGQSEGGVLYNVGEWIGGKMNVTGPRKIIEDDQGTLFKSKGYRVIFHPPRVTKALTGTTESICEMAYRPGWSDRSWGPRFILSAADWFLPRTLDKFEVLADGKSYHNLLDYIRDNVRDTVLSEQGNNEFDAWWRAYVGKEDAKLTAEMMQNYAEVINGPFMKTVKRDDYYWCDDNPRVKGGRLEHYLSQLRNLGDTCNGARSHRLAYGVINSVRDQARLFTAMMIDLYVSNSGTLAKPNAVVGKKTSESPRSLVAIENTVIMPARRMLEAYDNFVRALTYASEGKNPNELAQEFIKQYQTFVKLVGADGDTGLQTGAQTISFGTEEEVVKVKNTGQLAIVPARPPAQAVWMAKLAEGLLQTIGEWQSWSKVATMTPQQ